MAKSVASHPIMSFSFEKKLDELRQLLHLNHNPLMKTSLSHLPSEKQEQILAITEIIQTAIAAEKIILFGSYAKGTYKEQEYISEGIRYDYISDYDFLVVTSEHLERPATIESSIMNQVHRYRPPVNLEIHTIDYINDGLSWGQYFFADIVKEGILLYDSGSTQFSEPRTLSQTEKREKAQNYFDIWYPQASAFIDGGRFFHSKGNYKQGAFLLHQAAENLYSATLLVFTDYKPKIHNLWKLRKKTKQYSEELFLAFPAETNKHEEHLFDLLKRGYIDARYKRDYLITGEELEAIIDRVARMEGIVKDICEVKIQSLDADQRS